MKHCLVTGGAGFIGSHLVDSLLANEWRVSVIDNFDPFYDRRIKLLNCIQHVNNDRYRLYEGDICCAEDLRRLSVEHFDVIIHLAAKAGVRPSILDPLAYQEVNVRGTQNLLEFARLRSIKQFVFASSSSVYGINPNTPWSEADSGLMPISPYASTKLSGEFLGHVYSHLYGIRFLALRFFTVFGPRQRPDLAIHKFARNILAGKPISIYGDGRTRRDYTYVADIVNGIRAALTYQSTPFEIVNLGNNRTVSLSELVGALEAEIGGKAIIDRLPDQPGDVPQTWADISKASALLGYSPSTPLTEGLRIFIDWLRAFDGEVKTPRCDASGLRMVAVA